MKNQCLSVDAVNSLNETGLFVAVACRCRPCVNIVLSAFPPPEKNKPGVGGATALHVASAMGHIDIVNDLLAEGAEVCVLDAVDRTPLHAVVGSNQSVMNQNRLDCLLILLDLGGEVVIDIQDTLGGDTALMLCVRLGWVEGARALLQVRKREGEGEKEREKEREKRGETFFGEEGRGVNERRGAFHPPCQEGESWSKKENAASRFHASLALRALLFQVVESAASVRLRSKGCSSFL